MQVLRSRLPDLQTLTAGLNAIFNGNASAGHQVIVLDRQPNTWISSFPSEVVTCRFNEGSARQIFCKYEAGHSHSAYGHRGGVAYEAAVYRYVLQSLSISTPRFYGVYSDKTTDETWLILEYLDSSAQMHTIPEPAAMHLAARWLGQFHATAEAYLSSTPLPFLTTYDTEYYLGWVRRTLLFADPLSRRFPWLANLCKRFEEFVALLVTLPATIIHGEYYPGNVLFRDGAIYPVDWESAAIAVGEIDLASLTDRWPAEVAQQCELEYQQTRWPQGSPADFERALAAARLYVQFRWLGDRPDWTIRESSLSRFEHMHTVGKQLGLI
jgi:hypothetical protein